MRAALGIFGLALGLLAAVLSFGRVDHLRQVAPGAVPGWATAIENGSGLFSGQMRHNVPPLGQFVLAWGWRALTGDGATWRLTLDGTGLTGTGQLRLAAPLEQAELIGAAGALDLGALPDGPVPGLTGELRFDQLEGAYRFSDRRLLRLTGSGRILGAALNGVPLGEGTMTLNADVGGRWELSFDIKGPALSGEGTLTGRVDRRSVSIDAELRPHAALPDDWTRALSLVADRNAAGHWRLSTTVPF